MTKSKEYEGRRPFDPEAQKRVSLPPGCPKCGERHGEGESCKYYDPDPTDG